MALVPLTALDGSTVYVEQNLTSGLEAISPTLLPVGVPAGTRVSIVRGADAIETSYLSVQGTVAAVAAIIGAGGPPPPVVFGDFAETTGAGSFLTTSAVIVPVPGTQITIQPGEGGVRLFLASGAISTDNVANGGVVTMMKNGGALGGTGFWVAGSLAIGDSIGWMEQVADNAAPGDVYELAIAAFPGGGADQTGISGPRLSTWAFV